MPYYIIHEFGDDNHVWNILCTSFEEALGHVVHKIRDMCVEFRKENPQWQSVDPEYYMGKMEDDYCIEKAKEARGTMVANFCDYKIQYFVKEVHLKPSE
jgi:hypothetical protein